MAIDRVLLREYLLAAYPGSVRVQIGNVLDFLDLSNGEQQAAIDAWKAGHVERLQAQKDQLAIEVAAVDEAMAALGG